uniref:Transmembrane protein 18 n=1 Tax=Kalanchoe fedtschenkoi TaxID=63787 RepID=A0A7N0RDY8_KALFE
MEEVIGAVEDHVNQMADLLQQFTAEFRSGLRPAYDNFIGFFHAIDWKEPWLQCLMSFHVILLLVILFSRKHTNFQMCLFLLALSGVYFAESINAILSRNWKSFATQNYFDRQGIFLSALWSGPLLMNAVLILIITLVSLCIQMVKWKKAELRHKARLARSKQE